MSNKIILCYETNDKHQNKNVKNCFPYFVLQKETGNGRIYSFRYSGYLKIVQVKRTNINRSETNISPENYFMNFYWRAMNFLF